MQRPRRPRGARSTANLDRAARSTDRARPRSRKTFPDPSHDPCQRVTISAFPAIDGYDPVAYFTEKRPVEGSSEFTHEWTGATWHFASASNRDAFAAAPEKYAPQYGGYCAYAVSQGTTADIDPASWHIRDGKLYLNLNPDIQKVWIQDIPGYISKADADWPGLMAD